MRTSGIRTSEDRTSGGPPVVKGLNKEEITRLNLDRFCDVMQRLLFLHPLLLLVLKTFIWVFAPTTIPGDKLE